MSGHYYVLEGHTPRPAPLLEWAVWMESADRGVALDLVGTAVVSTVFVGLNQSWTDTVPLLFETKVFGGHRDGDRVLYHTWDAAVAGHRSMVEAVIEGERS